MQSEFGLLIKRLRLQAGLSQDRLAKKLQRERSWIAHIERGDCLPNAAQIEALAACLGVATDYLLLTAHLNLEVTDTEERMSRQVVRQFSASWRAGLGRQLSRNLAPRGTQGLRLLAFLNRHVSDATLRAKLKNLGLGCLEVAQLALALLDKGAQWARLSWAQVGFPVALLDGENSCLNHLPRPCLVWADKERALALFGESTATTPRYYPPVLACIEHKQRRYLALEGGRREGMAECDSGQVRRLALGGANRESVGIWLKELLGVASPASPRDTVSVK